MVKASFRMATNLILKIKSLEKGTDGQVGNMGFVGFLAAE